MKNYYTSKTLLSKSLLGALLMAGMLLFTACEETKTEEVSTPDPVAIFAVAINELTVTTSNTSTDAKTYAWTFGDDATSTEKAPSHTYAADGTYKITLKVTSEDGKTSEASKDVTVKKNVIPPAADFTFVAKDLEVTFTNASANATSYAWDFGDSKTSTDKDPVHTYEKAGDYMVMLVATGQDDLKDTTKVEVKVVAAPVIEPVAAFTFEAKDLKVTFTNKSTDATTYAWDFGDGNTSTDKDPVHTYAAAGKYTVKLVAKDAADKMSEKSEEITVSEAATGGGTSLVTNGTFDDFDASGEEKDSPEWKAIRDQNNDAWELPSELEAWVKANVSNGTVLAGMTTSENTGEFATKFHTLARRIYQAVTVESGKTYTVKFYSRTNSADAVDYMDAYVLAGEILDETTLETNLAKVVVQGTDSQYAEYTMTFTATSNTAVLYFRALTDDVDGFIDDVTMVEN